MQCVCTCGCVQEGKVRNLQFWQAHPQNFLVLFKTRVDIQKAWSELNITTLLWCVIHITTLPCFTGTVTKEHSQGCPHWDTQILIKTLQWGRRRKWPKPVQSCALEYLCDVPVDSHDNKRKSDKGKSKVGSLQVDKQETWQWRTIDLMVTSNNWSRCWLSSISRSELTFQMEMLRHQSSQQGSPAITVYFMFYFSAALHIYKIPYIYPLVKMAGYLIFPSNKASALINIAKHSLRQNLLWVSCRQWIMDFTDICTEIHLSRGDW